MPRYFVPVFLWVLALLVGAALYFGPKRDVAPDASDVVQLTPAEGEAGLQNTPDGRAIPSVPWKHLPDVDRFVLTDQAGNDFDSADLHGRPYVVSFFFATCPSFCRDLNNKLHEVNQLVKKQDVQFLTITVDPENDTVKVLSDYAAGYDAKPERWAFLTGPQEELVRIGQRTFNVVVDRDTHTDDILLVDKWGRYRDRFKWSSPEDMKRFVKVVAEVAGETQPPLNKTFQTRNVMAGIDPPALNSVPWLRDFHLRDLNGDPFFSRDLTGSVWLAHFFGRGGDSVKTAQAIAGLASDDDGELKVVSIDAADNVASSESDAIAGALKSEGVDASVCGGLPAKVRRIASEYFGVSVDDAKLESLVFVVDRWGNVRKAIDVTTQDLSALYPELKQQLNGEDVPPKPVR
jgi:protein SCO1/2